MDYWRMKLRAGHHGPDMWQSCRDHGVAAITYHGVRNVDLSLYSRTNHPPGWDQVEGSAKGSLGLFAWDIRGGDVIYVASSLERQIVGLGYVQAAIGEVAYRFDRHSPIVASDGERWPHLINVDWDLAFAAFPYKRPRAPQNTVLKLNNLEVSEFERAAQEAEHRQWGLSNSEIRETYLLETAYPRYTPVALRIIRREHVSLSNQFKLWLKNTKGILAAQEHQHIDATFEALGRRFLAEFKIAYLGNTKKAIREALGQILEYNHYPPRASHDSWLLILDKEPSGEDRTFLSVLREGYGLPLTLGWKADSTFEFEPSLSF
jgi:hypothetical protein